MLLHIFMYILGFLGLILTILGFVGYNKLGFCPSTSLKNKLRMCIGIGSSFVALSLGFIICNRRCDCVYEEETKEKIWFIVGLIIVVSILNIVLVALINKDVKSVNADTSTPCNIELGSIPALMYIANGLLLATSIGYIILQVKKFHDSKKPKIIDDDDDDKDKSEDDDKDDDKDDDEDDIKALPHEKERAAEFARLTAEKKRLNNSLSNNIHNLFKLKVEKAERAHKGIEENNKQVEKYHILQDRIAKQKIDLSNTSSMYDKLESDRSSGVDLSGSDKSGGMSGMSGLSGLSGSDKSSNPSDSSDNDLFSLKI
jgi:hypothetical protein